MMRCSFLCVVLQVALFLPTNLSAQEKIARISAPDAETTITLVLRSTTDIDVLKPVIVDFVLQNPEISVTFEQWGSNELFQNSLEACAGDVVSASAVFSSGVHQMIDLVNRACASAYRSEQTAALPAARRWRDELWGITKEPAVMIYNTDLVPAEDVPETRFALLDLMRRPTSIYWGKIATYDIEASGLGYLFAFMDSLEASSFGALLEGFSRTNAVATCCSSEIIKGVSNGDYLIAYNVLGSYVDGATFDNIGVIHPQDYTLFLSRAYMIPKDGPEKPAAALLLDFMLSPRGQNLLKMRNLFYAETSDASPLPKSAERGIAIEPTLLVAGDKHRRKQFVDLWRSAFAQHHTVR
jgi:ABC-type Fe3+ transport system substrate-binding protein